MFVVWSLVIHLNHICSQTPIWPLTLFVTSIRRLPLLLVVGWSQFKRLISYFLQVIVRSSHFPAHSVSHLSFIDRCPIIPCINWRWLCSIISIFRCQARFQAIFSFTLRCIRLKMISVFYPWVSVNTLSVILNSNGKRRGISWLSV